VEGVEVVWVSKISIAERRRNLKIQNFFALFNLETNPFHTTSKLGEKIFESSSKRQRVLVQKKIQFALKKS
jgi:hypothetical protein